MARPAKAIDNATGHHLAAEKERRRAAEQAALTGIEIRERPEVKKNKLAHKEFKRVIELLNAAGKNDALIETVINRYCILLAECAVLEDRREKIFETATKLEEKLDELGAGATFTDVRDAAKAIASIYSTYTACDRQIQQKRTMLFNIERDNGFTIAAALRAIPKKVNTENPLAKALRDDD